MGSDDGAVGRPSCTSRVEKSCTMLPITCCTIYVYIMYRLQKEALGQRASQSITSRIGSPGAGSRTQKHLRLPTTQQQASSQAQRPQQHSHPAASPPRNVISGCGSGFYRPRVSTSAGVQGLGETHWLLSDEVEIRHGGLLAWLLSFRRHVD